MSKSSTGQSTVRWFLYRLNPMSSRQFSEIETPLSKATDTAVDRVECAEKFSATPAPLKTSFSHRAIVTRVTEWCGLLIDKNNWFLSGPSLRVAEWFREEWKRSP